MLALAVFVLFRPTIAEAQDDRGEPDLHRLPSASVHAPDEGFSRSAKISQKATDANGYASVMAEDQLGGTPWPRPDIGTFPRFTAWPAGDVNGDGIADWVHRVRSLPDESTSALGDQTDKTFLKYGGADFPDTYYDEVYREFLTPAGDLVGTDETDALAIDRETGVVRIFSGSPTGYRDTGTSVSAGISGLSLVGYGDLDNDGFDDAVLALSQSPDLVILFGGATGGDITTQSFSPSFSDEASFSYAVGNIDSDPEVELVRLSGDAGTGTLSTVDVHAFEFLAAGARLDVQLMFTTSGFRDFFQSRSVNAIVVDEVTDGGLAEIIVRDFSTTVFQSFSGETTYDPAGADYAGAYPVGDVDGDGTGDFLIENSTGLFFGFGGGSTISSDQQLPIPPGETIEFPQRERILGDVTGDGRSDVYLRRIGTSTFGPLLARLTASGPTVENGFEFSRTAYRSEDIEQAINIGPWDGDADDDLLVFTRSFLVGDEESSGRVSLYTGDPFAGSAPALSITHPDGARASLAVTGDFTGNGQKNIAIGWEAEAPMVSVYEVGQGPTPIFTISFADLPGDPSPSTFGVVAIVENAGDVNDDGVDDLLVGVPDSPAEVYLYLGGSSLPAAPDATVGSTGQFYGSNLQALGDINGDGIDDFAAGLPEIQVFFGQDNTAPDFSLSDVTLSVSPGLNESIALYPLGMSSGDFNGDGFPDLAAKPGFFEDTQTGEGLDAIRVYHGGPDFDNTPEAVFPIPASPLDLRGTAGEGDFLTSSTGELTPLPDLDQDGSDELLLGTVVELTNALVFSGSGASAPIPVSVLQAPDQSSGLGANNNSTLNNNRSSAVGDFTGDGQLAVLLPQLSSGDFLGSPLYRFPLGVRGLTASQASVSVNPDSDGLASVSFLPSEVGLSGIDFRGASGSGEVEVLFFHNAPSSTSGISEATTSAYRVVLETTSTLSFDEADVRFRSTALGGITDATDVTVYRRPTPGAGTFAEVGQVQFDAATGDIVATVTSFSEFVLASNTNPLPVELEGLSAQVSGEAVTLTWRTLSETGNDGFQVERRVGTASASNWSHVGFVEGAGTRSTATGYRFSDRDVPYEAETVAYRLRQVDVDGTESISDPVRVQFGAPSELRLRKTFPNPATGHVTVRYETPTAAPVRMDLYNVLGQRVRQVQRGEVSAGRHESQLDVGSLASGVYFLRIVHESGTATQRMTIVR